MLQNKHFLKTNNSHNILLFNIVLWVSSFIILLFLFSGRSSPEKIDFIYTICFLITLIIPISFNLYFLIPKYLKKEKFIIFCLFFMANLILFSEFNPLFFDFFVDVFFNDYYFISYHNQIEIYFIFFVFFMLTSLLKLAEDWVYLNKKENKILRAQKQEIESQLYYLKGQINPHFLFNSLNALYDLAIHKKENLTSAILQLSDILRYVIYDVEVDKISLKKEIDLINNYIAFEKNRHVNNARISFKHDVNEHLEIYPMLLLPLIENSFKHGLKSGINTPFVKINLKESNGNIVFEISNNFKKNFGSENNNYKGIGLKNIQENLALIYPNKHSFKTVIEKNIFTVNLSLNLNE